MEVLQVKNMVCPRSIMAVENLLNDLSIDYKSVVLGQVTLNQELSPQLYEQLSNKLNEIGFEIIVDKRTALVQQVKTIIIDLIYKHEQQLKVNLSDYLHEQLGLDYNYISKQFSEIENQTIEQYVLAIKVERVKELLRYNELSLTEISDALHYSSVAHLSAQFKKVTGMTPTQFKLDVSQSRKSISDT